MSMHLGEAQLSTGSTGTEVKSLQQILQGQGYNVGPVDGIYGPQTQAAVQAFQKTKGLLPDGIVGPQTWQALQPKPVVPAVLPPPIAASPRPYGSGMFSALSELSMPVVVMVGIGVMMLLSSTRKTR